MMRGIWWGLLLLPLACGCAVPRSGEDEVADVGISICSDVGAPAGTEADAKVREEMAAQAAAKDVELVGFLGAPAEPGQAPRLEWQRPREFRGGRPAASLPERSAEARFGYSFERGPLHLTVIETAAPMAVNSEAYLWLMQDLSLAKQPWKVVILPRPIVQPSPVSVDEARMDQAVLLAREGVALAIAAGGPAYFRTARIGEAQQESVRYVILGGDGWSAPPKPLPAWTRRTIAEPCFCVLHANKSTLRWEAFDAQGRLLDLLDVPADEGPAGEAHAFSWSEVLSSREPQPAPAQ